MLDGGVIDHPLFKKLCYAGIPMKYRLIAYQILLGVVGLDTAKFDAILETKEQRYRQHLEECQCVQNTDKEGGLGGARHENPACGCQGDRSRDCAGHESGKIHPQQKCEDDVNKLENTHSPIFLDVKYEISKSLEHQIQIDILRISTIYKKYGEIDVSPVFYNVLKITAYKRPYIGYAQGMADLIVPFVHLFFTTSGKGRPEAEDDGSKALVSQSVVFFCFSNLLNKIQIDIFDLQGRLLSRLEQVLKIVDEEVLRHLRSIGLELHMVCFRWFSCLFIREFSLNSWYRIFDSMLCDEISEFVVFFGAALLMWFRVPILKGDFSSIVLQMQNLQNEDLSVENVETLLGSVNYLRKEYRDKTKP